MTTTKKKTVRRIEKKLITKATGEEVKNFLKENNISKSSIGTYNKCYFKNGLVVANKGINVLFKDKDGKVYTATNGEKVDNSLEFIGAVQTIQHPEKIAFII